jgi:hypothetical protein
MHYEGKTNYLHGREEQEERKVLETATQERVHLLRADVCDNLPGQEVSHLAK